LDWFVILVEWLKGYGYIGALLIAFFGNLIPFLPVPFLIPVFLLSGVMEPLPLGITVGIGATIGKCVSYMIGRGGATFLSDKKRQELKCFSNAMGKFGDLAIFIFSAFPLPDDVIIIPFGLAKYNFKRFFAMLLLGKLFLGLLVAYAGHYSFEVIIGFLGGDNVLLGVLGSILLLVILTAIILMIDWIEAVEYINSNGILAYVRMMLSRIFKDRRIRQQAKDVESGA